MKDTLSHFLHFSSFRAIHALSMHYPLLFDLVSWYCLLFHSWQHLSILVSQYLSISFYYNEVVSLSLFGNAQKVARDGVRRAEINAIAKSFESSRDIPNATYQYNTTYYNNDFGNSNPADPLGTRNYCIGINTTDTTPPAPPAAWTSGCPAAPFNNAFSDTWTMAAGTRSWTACASLEATTTPFCIKSIIR